MSPNIPPCSFKADGSFDDRLLDIVYIEVSCVSSIALLLSLVEVSPSSLLLWQSFLPIIFPGRSLLLCWRACTSRSLCSGKGTCKDNLTEVWPTLLCLGALVEEVEEVFVLEDDFVSTDVDVVTDKLSPARNLSTRAKLRLYLYLQYTFPKGFNYA